MIFRQLGLLFGATVLLGACSGGSGSGVNFTDGAQFSELSSAQLMAIERAELSQQLNELLEAAAPGRGAAAFTFPHETNLDAIPQDPSNPLTAEKVALGQLLYHETALAQDGNNPALAGTYSCASCHHVAAGFKAGVPQGISEGGTGFGINGEGRVLADGFDPAMPEGDPMKPDLQPIATPTALNVAYQDVMLWNGQFGNAINGLINAGIDMNVLATPGTPKEANVRMLAGVETQAVAGLGVHRIKVEDDTVLQTHPAYQALFSAAFPEGSDDVLEDAAKAIAAYERTLLATEAPFQRWLNGDGDLGLAALRGATVFFGKGACVDCHRGPALSSEVGASADEVFFNIGFADFDTSNPRIHGTVDDATSRGRGGFTGEPEDDYKFKIPQLYNLADSSVYGHGASFSSIREVVAYKNAAVAQQPLAINNLDSRFVPLGLSESEIDDLTAFISNALYDPNLERYVPDSLPSGQCFPVNDDQARSELDC